MGAALDRLAEHVGLTRIFVAKHPRMTPGGGTTIVDDYWKNIRTLGDLDRQERAAYESQVLQGVVPPADPYDPDEASPSPFDFDLNDPVEFQTAPGEWEPGIVRGIFPPGTAPEGIGPSPDWAEDRSVFKVLHPDTGIEHIVANDKGVLRPGPPTVLPEAKRRWRDRLRETAASAVLGVSMGAAAASEMFDKMEARVPGLGEWTTVMGEVALETVAHSAEADGEQVALARVYVPRHPRFKAGNIEDVDPYSYTRGQGPDLDRLQRESAKSRQRFAESVAAHPPGYIDPETGPIEPGWGGQFLPSPATIKRTEAVARLHAKVRGTARPPDRIAGTMRDLGASIRKQGFPQLGMKVGNIGAVLDSGSTAEAEDAIDEAFLEWRATPQQGFLHAVAAPSVLSIRDAQSIYNAIWDARLDLEARQPA